MVTVQLNKNPRPKYSINSIVEAAQIIAWKQLIASKSEIYPIMIDGCALSFLTVKMVTNRKDAARIDKEPTATKNPFSTAGVENLSAPVSKQVWRFWAATSSISSSIK